MPVSYIGAGSPALAPPDGLPVSSHYFVLQEADPYTLLIKHALPLAFLGSANGSDGQRLERPAYSRIQLPPAGPFWQRLQSSVRGHRDCLAPSLLVTALTGVGNQPLSRGPLGLGACSYC